MDLIGQYLELLSITNKELGMAARNLCTLANALWLCVSLVLCFQTGCGGATPESDAKKMAALMCEAQQLAKRAASGDKAAIKEGERLATKIKETGERIGSKYSADKKKTARFGAALGKAMAACK